MKKPIRTPLWYFQSETDLGADLIPIGNLALFDRDIYYKDNNIRCGRDTNVRQAIVQRNLIKMPLPDGMEKVPLEAPKCELITLFITRINKEIVIRANDVDKAADTIRWEIKTKPLNPDEKMEMQVIRGSLEGSRDNTITLMTDVLGDLYVRAYAVPMVGDGLYCESEASNCVHICVTEPTKALMRKPTIKALKTEISVFDPIDIIVEDYDREHASEFEWDINDNFITESDLHKSVEKIRGYARETGEVRFRLRTSGSSDRLDSMWSDEVTVKVRDLDSADLFIGAHYYIDEIIDLSGGGDIRELSGKLKLIEAEEQSKIIYVGKREHTSIKIGKQEEVKVLRKVKAKPESTTIYLHKRDETKIAVAKYMNKSRNILREINKINLLSATYDKDKDKK